MESLIAWKISLFYFLTLQNLTVNHNILLTLLEVSILEVVYGVSQQPPGPVDEVDGAGELVVGGGHVVDVPNADHADTGHVGVVDEGQSWLYENVLL